MHPRGTNSGTDSEDFTSECCDENADLQSEIDDLKLVLTLLDNTYKGTEKSVEKSNHKRSGKKREELDPKPSNLPNKKKDTNVDLFVSQKVAALSL